MTYEDLLNKAYESLPKIEESAERLEIPSPEIIFQGRQTIIKNFSQISEAIRRNPNHLLKYLTKELATPAGFDGARATLQSKISKRMIENKLDSYIKEYVICKECGKPDTKIIREDRIDFLKCEACGAKASVKSVK